MRKFAVVVMLAALVAALAPTVSAQDDGQMMGLEEFMATFSTTPAAADAGLADVTGWTHVRPAEGRLHISLTPNGAALPDGTVLEGWIVDAGLDGGPGTTNASSDDEAFGTPFEDESLHMAVEAAPYALSTGALAPLDDGTWDLMFDIPGYNFSPYDAVVITLESDGNSLDGFDPRPGTPMFIALFTDGQPVDMMSDNTSGDNMSGDNMSGDQMAEGDMSSDNMSGDQMAEGDMSSDNMSGDQMAEGDMSGDQMAEGDMSGDQMAEGDMMDMGPVTEVTLTPTATGEAAGWADVTGTAMVWVESGEIQITLKLGGASVPDNTAVEGWLVDAGLNGGPGTTNVSDADETFGVGFGDAALDALVDSAPYALSTGTVSTDDMGDLTLSFTVNGYNFSPYDAVVITLESDGNSTDGFDPRPGAPVLMGLISG